MGLSETTPKAIDPLARAHIHSALESARSGFERDLRAVCAEGRAEDRLEAMRQALDRAGYELTHQGPGLLFARRAAQPGAPRVLLHHSIGSDRAPASLEHDAIALSGPDLASRLGPALAAVHAFAPGRLEPPAELHLGFSSSEVPLDASRAPAVHGVLIGEGRWPGSRPAATVGARGRLTVRLALATGDRTAPLADELAGLGRNALAELTRLVGSLTDPLTGALRVPGLDEGASDMTIAEAQHFALSGFDSGGLAEQSGLRPPRHEDPLEAMEALWARPTLELLSIDSNADERASLPTQAQALLALYLVPHMDARSAMERLSAHLREREPRLLAVEHIEHVEPWLAKDHGPLADALREAYRSSFGARAALVRRAAPLPEASSLARGLEVPVACVSTARIEQRLGSGLERVERAHLAHVVALYAHLAQSWASRLPTKA